MASIQFNRVYRFSNVQTGTCLDLSSIDHHSIIGYQQGSGANQMWMFQDAPGHGNYYIKSVSKGEYVSIANVPSNGQAIVVSPTPFAWNIKNDSGALVICVPGSNYCIDLDRGSSALGTRVQVWNHLGGKNQLSRQLQKWMFQDAPGYGNYYIKSVSKGEYVSISNVPSNGQAIVASPTPFAWNPEGDDASRARRQGGRT